MPSGTALAAESASGPRVVIRTDAGPSIGLGHLLRMRSLAETLVRRGATVDVIGSGVAAAGQDDAPWSVAELDVPVQDQSGDLRTTARLLTSHAPDVVIVDNYALSEVWEHGIAERFPEARVVAFDDVAERRHRVDLLVDPNIGTGGPGLTNGVARQLLSGTAYAPIGAEYRDAAPRPPRRSVPPTLLVSLGGGRSGIIPELAQAIIAEPRLRHVRLELVVPDPSERAAVAEIMVGRRDCHVHGRVATMLPLLARADLVLGAGGTSAWQRLRLGLPSVIVTLADNQLRTGGALHDLGLARWVEPGADPERIVGEVADAIDDGPLHERAAEFGPLLVDGRGAERVALALVPPQSAPTLRFVDAGDSAALLAIANDPVTRAGSRVGRRIRPEEHADWFGRTRAAMGATFWVAEVEGLVVGHVRFSPLAEGWELNYGLDPAARGLGWSGPMVRDALRSLAAGGGPGPVVAVVHGSNEASRRSLTRLGFRADGTGRAEQAGASVPDGFAAYILEDASGLR